MAIKPYYCRICIFASEPFFRNYGDNPCEVVECRLHTPDIELGFPTVAVDSWCSEFVFDDALLAGKTNAQAGEK